MAECTTLLRWRTFIRTGGSNPPLSAKTDTRAMIMWSNRDDRNRKGRKLRLSPWALGLFFLTAGCRGPSLSVTTEPDATLLVDGRVTPQDEPITFAYYGERLLQAEPEAEEHERFRYLRAERSLTVSEPVTPWVFPFDFLVEVITQPFAGTAHQSVTLQLPENPNRVLQGVEPPGAEEVRARGVRARVER